MNEEKKIEVIAEAERIEAIKEFLSMYYSVSELFETAANAGSVLLGLVNQHQVGKDDLQYITRLIDQHVMLANLLKPFEGKEGAV